MEKKIIKINNPPNVVELFPTFQYVFQDEKVNEEANVMYENLLSFLRENYELAISPEMSIDYKTGFQQALALTQLWINSIYLDKQVMFI